MSETATAEATTEVDPTVEPEVVEAPPTDENTVFIDIDTVAADDVKLRKVYNDGDEAEEYQDMKKDILARGLINAITVRPNPRAGQPKDENDLSQGTHSAFTIITGGHRTQIHRDLVAEGHPQFQKIRAHITPMDDNEALLEQISENAHRIDTRDGDYADAVFKVLSENPNLSKAGLAKKLHKSPAWISGMLRISSLPQEVKDSINEGKITAASAIILGRLFDKKLKTVVSQEEFYQWVGEAKKLGSEEFVLKGTQRLDSAKSEVKEEKANNRAKRPEKPEMSPSPLASAKIVALYEEVCADGYKGKLDKATLEFIVRMDKKAHKANDKAYAVRVKNWENSNLLKTFKKQASDKKVPFETGAFKGKTVLEQLEVVAKGFAKAGDTATAKSIRDQAQA